MAPLDCFEPCRFARSLAQVVETCATDLAAAKDLELLDSRRVEREDSLDADAVRDLADCESCAAAAAVDFNYYAFKGLKTFFFTFDNFALEAHSVADMDLGQVFTQTSLFELLDDAIHGNEPRSRAH